ncbi:hypothetical protein [Flavobacterium pedocola]
MKYPLKKILITLHISCGILLLLNFVSNKVCGVTLYFAYSQIIKYCFLISGVVLFFLVNRKLKAYFSIYIFSPIVALLSLLFGLAGIVFIFMMIALIWPKSEISNSNNYILYAKSSGPLNLPNEFELTEHKYFIFERRLAEFKNREYNEDLENCEINVVNNLAHITFTVEDRDYTTDRITKTDAEIKIAIK